MAAPDLSTRQLRAFVALAELRNFTRAAQASHLSQPAFSALIRALEDAIGTRLFDRNTRSVQLTPEGRLFEPSARRLLADAARALADLADHVERRKGRVHVAALPSLAAGWLPAQFAELRTRVLCTDRFHLVCPARHPLLREPRLTLRKLAHYPFIHMTRNSSVRQALEAALHPLAMNTVLEVEQLATVMGMVEAGLGISVVPTLTLYQFRRDPPPGDSTTGVPGVPGAAVRGQPVGGGAGVARSGGGADGVAFKFIAARPRRTGAAAELRSSLRLNASLRSRPPVWTGARAGPVRS